MSWYPSEDHASSNPSHGGGEIRAILREEGSRIPIADPSVSDAESTLEKLLASKSQNAVTGYRVIQLLKEEATRKPVRRSNESEVNQLIQSFLDRIAERRTRQAAVETERFRIQEVEQSLEHALQLWEGATFTAQAALRQLLKDALHEAAHSERRPHIRRLIEMLKEHLRTHESAVAGRTHFNEPVTA